MRWSDSQPAGGAPMAATHDNEGGPPRCCPCCLQSHHRVTATKEKTSPPRDLIVVEKITSSPSFCTKPWTMCRRRKLASTPWRLERFEAPRDRRPHCKGVILLL
ncbi:putative transmembrane protein [Sesbania bispinosa]|nr:putative transmembrane protein [Sesbania bispinosa]